jgi:hypothetical protein
MKRMATVLLALGLLVGPAAPRTAHSQQVADTTWAPPPFTPAWPAGTGPVVAIDEGHRNFHTLSGRFAPFARLVRSDGWRVTSHTGSLTPAALAAIDLLVIANPLHERNDPAAGGRWELPTPPAFTPDEVAAVQDWVRDGGALLLIADHMPFPGAAAPLAAAFGAQFSNGFVAIGDDVPDLVFTRNPDGPRLVDHPVTRVDSVRTFTGSAFRPGPLAEPLLVLPRGAKSLECPVAWTFGPETPVIEVGGWCQGAVLRYGRGRVALFGEAAQFTAQLAGPDRIPVGMNAPGAGQNWRFLLDTLAWLAGKAGDDGDRVTKRPKPAPDAGKAG